MRHRNWIAGLVIGTFIVGLLIGAVTTPQVNAESNVSITSGEYPMLYHFRCSEDELLGFFVLMDDKWDALVRVSVHSTDVQVRTDGQYFTTIKTAPAIHSRCKRYGYTSAVIMAPNEEEGKRWRGKLESIRKEIFDKETAK